MPQGEDPLKLTYYDYFRTTYNNFYNSNNELNVKADEDDVNKKYQSHKNSLLDIINNENSKLRKEIYDYIESNNTISIFDKDNQETFTNQEANSDNITINEKFFEKLQEETIRSSISGSAPIADIINSKSNETYSEMKKIEEASIYQTIDQKDQITYLKIMEDINNTSPSILLNLIKSINTIAEDEDKIKKTDQNIDKPIDYIQLILQYFVKLIELIQNDDILQLFLSLTDEQINTWNEEFSIILRNDTQINNVVKSLLKCFHFKILKDEPNNYGLINVLFVKNNGLLSILDHIKNDGDYKDIINKKTLKIKEILYPKNSTDDSTDDIFCDVFTFKDLIKEFNNPDKKGLLSSYNRGEGQENRKKLYSLFYNVVKTFIKTDNIDILLFIYKELKADSEAIRDQLDKLKNDLSSSRVMVYLKIRGDKKNNEDFNKRYDSKVFQDTPTSTTNSLSIKYYNDNKKKYKGIEDSVYKLDIEELFKTQTAKLDIKDPEYNEVVELWEANKLQNIDDYEKWKQSNQKYLDDITIEAKSENAFARMEIIDEILKIYIHEDVLGEEENGNKWMITDLINSEIFFFQKTDETDEPGKIENNIKMSGYISDAQYYNEENYQGDKFADKVAETIQKDKQIIIDVILETKYNPKLIRGTDIKITKRTHFVFGKFNSIYLPYQSNSDVAQDDKIKNDIINGLKNKKPIFIFGYGQSGAGKTSSLIYADFGKGEDGIIVEITKEIANTLDYKNLDVKIYEYYKATEKVKKEARINDDREVMKNESEIINFKYDEGVQNFVMTNKTSLEIVHKYNLPENNGKFKYSDKDAILGKVLKDKVNDDRFVKATTNNLQSSRSHVVVHLTFSKLTNPDDKIYLFLGDFAGVENSFTCENFQTKLDFMNLTKSNYKFQPFYIPSNCEDGFKGGANIEEEINDIDFTLVDPTYNIIDKEYLNKNFKTFKSPDECYKPTKGVPAPGTPSSKTESLLKDDLGNLFDGIEIEKLGSFIKKRKDYVKDERYTNIQMTDIDGIKKAMEFIFYYIQENNNFDELFNQDIENIIENIISDSQKLLIGRTQEVYVPASVINKTLGSFLPINQGKLNYFNDKYIEGSDIKGSDMNTKELIIIYGKLIEDKDKEILTEYVKKLKSEKESQNKIETEKEKINVKYDAIKEIIDGVENEEEDGAMNEIFNTFKTIVNLWQNNDELKTKYITSNIKKIKILNKKGLQTDHYIYEYTGEKPQNATEEEKIMFILSKHIEILQRAKSSTDGGKIRQATIDKIIDTLISSMANGLEQNHVKWTAKNTNFAALARPWWTTRFLVMATSEKDQEAQKGAQYHYDINYYYKIINNLLNDIIEFFPEKKYGFKEKAKTYADSERSGDINWGTAKEFGKQLLVLLLRKYKDNIKIKKFNLSEIIPQPPGVLKPTFNYYIEIVPKDIAGIAGKEDTLNFINNPDTEKEDWKNDIEKIRTVNEYLQEERKGLNLLDPSLDKKIGELDSKYENYMKIINKNIGQGQGTAEEMEKLKKQKIQEDLDNLEILINELYVESFYGSNFKSIKDYIKEPKQHKKTFESEYGKNGEEVSKKLNEKFSAIYGTNKKVTKSCLYHDYMKKMDERNEITDNISELERKIKELAIEQRIYYENAKMIIDDWNAIINFGDNICQERRKEGKYINNSLADVKTIIERCLYEKMKSALYTKPHILDDICKGNYCFDGDDKCLTSRSTPGFKSNIIFNDIYETCYNDNKPTDEKLKTLYNELIISVFCVLNLSPKANNPPNEPYFNINFFKKYLKKINTELLFLNDEYNAEIITNTNLFIKKLESMFKYYKKGRELSNDKGTMIQKIKKKLQGGKLNELYSVDPNKPSIIDKLVDYINSKNSYTAIGTLEFIDKLSKFNKIDNVCELKNDINIDQSDNWISLKERYLRYITNLTSAEMRGGYLIKNRKKETLQKERRKQNSSRATLQKERRKQNSSRATLQKERRKQNMKRATLQKERRKRNMKKETLKKKRKNKN